MTERKAIDQQARVAIWEVWGKRCFYTNDPIEYSDLQIDHVIPVEGGDAIVEALQAKGLIASDFDLNGFENLVPMKGFRNRQKTDQEFDEKSIVFFLNLAKERKAKIEEQYRRAVESDRALSGYLRMKAQAESNDLAVEDVLEVVRHQADGVVTLRMAPAVEGEPIYSANSTYAAELLRKPFALGGGGIDGVTVHYENGDSFLCRTGEEFLAAKEAGACALTQFDMNMWGWAESTSEMLRAIAQSRFAKQSDIRYPRITFMNLEKWSAKWVIEAIAEGCSEHPEFEGHRTIADLVAAGLAKVAEQDWWSLEIDAKATWSILLRELLRADLDGDDEEEVLVNVVHFARDGTFRAGSVAIAKMVGGVLCPREDPIPRKAAGASGCRG